MWHKSLSKFGSCAAQLQRYVGTGQPAHSLSLKKRFSNKLLKSIMQSLLEANDWLGQVVLQENHNHNS